MRTELRARGQGGQGAITFGYVLGRAAAMYDDKESMLTEAYGPEITGGFARADVVFVDTVIDYPLVESPDIMVVMSREAWEAEMHNVSENTVVVYESKMCQIHEEEMTKGKFFGVPALEMALELKAKVVMNVILMAVTQSLTNVVSKDALKKSLLDRIPKRFEELNMNALEAGYKFAEGLTIGMEA